MGRAPKIGVVVSVCACCVMGEAWAQSGPGAPVPGRPFRSGTASVLVDVVVKDKKGAPVTDLRTPEFELLENGVIVRYRGEKLVGMVIFDASKR